MKNKKLSIKKLTVCVLASAFAFSGAVGGLLYANKFECSNFIASASQTINSVEELNNNPELIGINLIGKYAFANCSGLKSITIPASVTAIGEGAFSGCSNLTQIFFEAEEAPTFGNNVFANCPNLEVIAVKPNKEENYAKVLTSYADKVVGADYLLTDNSYFSVNEETKTATLTSSPNDVYGWVYIPSTIKVGDNKYEVTTIGESAFAGKTAVSNVLFPKNLTTIEAKAFEGVDFYDGINYGELTLPSTITSIAENAFSPISKGFAVKAEDSVLWQLTNQQTSWFCTQLQFSYAGNNGIHWFWDNTGVKYTIMQSFVIKKNDGVSADVVFDVQYFKDSFISEYQTEYSNSFSGKYMFILPNCEKFNISADINALTDATNATSSNYGKAEEWDHTQYMVKANANIDESKFADSWAYIWSNPEYSYIEYSSTTETHSINEKRFLYFGTSNTLFFTGGSN